MAELAAAFRAAQPFVYAVLALVTLHRWIRLRDRASGWAAAMFVVLAGVILVSRLVADDGSDGLVLARELLVAAFVLFPYLLFRFAATFRRPVPVLEALAAVLTVVTAGAVFFFEDLPSRGEARSGAFAAYSLLVAVQWVGLSVLVSTWFLRWSRGRPTVVRRRLRTLASGVVTLALALLVVVAAGGSGSSELADVVSGALALLAGPLFLAGLAPPPLLLAQWRLPDEARLQDAEAGLVAATSPSEVAEALLPFVARTMGGEAAVLSRIDGSVVACHGVEPGDAGSLVAAAEAGHDLGDSPVISIPTTTGRLSVAGDRFAPFFGRAETQTLARLGNLTEVALRRAGATEMERAAADELRRTHEAMRDFLSIASHDLRTPIAIIKGYSATMSSAWESLPDDEKRTYVATISRQADRLARLVSDLLTMSQLDAGAVEPYLGPVDLSVVVDELVSDLDRSDEVQVEIPGPVVVRADEDHASRIVQNLIENAFRYGEPPVTVTTSPADDGVELRVVDHGPGVPEPFVHRLFDRFARADGASDKARHGTGLGLSIVRGLARAGGGEAWYEAAHAGACFAVRFPRGDEES